MVYIIKENIFLERCYEFIRANREGLRMIMKCAIYNDDKYCYEYLYPLLYLYYRYITDTYETDLESGISKLDQKYIDILNKFRLTDLESNDIWNPIYNYRNDINELLNKYISKILGSSEIIVRFNI